MSSGCLFLIDDEERCALFEELDFPGNEHSSVCVSLWLTAPAISKVIENKMQSPNNRLQERENVFMPI